MRLEPRNAPRGQASPNTRRWWRWVAGSSSASVGSNRTPADSQTSRARGQIALITMGWRVMDDETEIGNVDYTRIAR